MKLQVEYLCGQPIIRGHHSEARHRRDIKRMDNNLKNAVREEKKVDYYETKIESIENNTSISSDDPQAIQKLEKKLEILQKNKLEIKSREHERYELPYVNAEIKRVTDRINELKELDQLDFGEIIFNGGKVICNKDINRIQILFDSKPDEDIRNILKRKGFKWSRNEGAWQRLFNKNGIKAAKSIVKEIIQKEFNRMKQEIDNYTQEQLLNNYRNLTNLDQENMSIEEIRQYLKDYWKEQIYRDEHIIVE